MKLRATFWVFTPDEPPKETLNFIEKPGYLYSSLSQTWYLITIERSLKPLDDGEVPKEHRTAALLLT